MNLAKIIDIMQLIIRRLSVLGSGSQSPYVCPFLFLSFPISLSLWRFDPDRAGPGELLIRLFDADVIPIHIFGIAPVVQREIRRRTIGESQTVHADRLARIGTGPISYLPWARASID